MSNIDELKAQIADYQLRLAHASAAVSDAKSMQSQIENDLHILKSKLEQAEIDEQKKVVDTLNQQADADVQRANQAIAEATQARLKAEQAKEKLREVGGKPALNCPYCHTAITGNFDTGTAVRCPSCDRAFVV